MSWLFKYVQVLLLHGGLWFMVFNAAFNNISVLSQAVSFIVGGKNRRTRRKSPPVASHWQTLSHNVVSSTLRHEFYYWMLCSVTLVTLHIFVLNFNIFLFCWCNICILCMIIPMQFLSKNLITVYEENVHVFVFTSIREKLWTLDTQG